MRRTRARIECQNRLDRARTVNFANPRAVTARARGALRQFAWSGRVVGGRIAHVVWRKGGRPRAVASGETQEGAQAGCWQARHRSKEEQGVRIILSAFAELGVCARIAVASVGAYKATSTTATSANTRARRTDLRNGYTISLCTNLFRHNMIILT